jgi:hypothetical protein
MDIQAIINAAKSQIGISVLSPSDDRLRMSLLGQQYVADWKHLLTAAGRMYRLSAVAPSAGDDVTEVVGGGAGTVLDLDQPEIVIGVDEGSILIPVEFEVGLRSDLDADADQAAVLLTADRSQAVPTSVTAATHGAVTPVNQLDGGPAFAGRAFVGVTGDITDPAPDEILAYKTWVIRDQGAAAAAVLTDLNYGKQFETPLLLRGPCGIYGYWGGTVAVNGIAQVLFAAVPSAWFPVE